MKQVSPINQVQIRTDEDEKGERFRYTKVEQFPLLRGTASREYR